MYMIHAYKHNDKLQALISEATVPGIAWWGKPELYKWKA